jgi:hypothetical protein
MIILAVLALSLAWLGYDLYGPRSSKLRNFDPNEIARLETGMWRSYYAKERVKLFTQLAELLRSQYHLPFATSNAVAYQAARAAFIFKEGKNRSDYEIALPHLVKTRPSTSKRRRGSRWNGGSYTDSARDTSREIWIALWPNCRRRFTRSQSRR